MSTSEQVRHFEREQTDAKERALAHIGALRAQLDALEGAIEADRQPPSDVTGDLGLQGQSSAIQRHVDAWIHAAQAVTVLRRIELAVVEADASLS